MTLTETETSSGLRVFKFNLSSTQVVLCAVFFQLILTFALSLTNLPLCDEGFYGVPAHILSVTGHLRNPVVETAGRRGLQGIDRSLFWMGPLAFALQAVAFKIFGLSFLAQRTLSVVCGAGATWFWYLALRRLIAERVAALAAVVLSADFLFIALSSRGRSDIVSLFFGMLALAAYMHWRERSLSLALIAANLACAASGLVHPCGGVSALIALVVLAVCLDRKRLSLGHLALVAGCYGGAALIWWFVHISQDPHLFVTQFIGNVRWRLRAPSKGRITGELYRYITAYDLQHGAGIKSVRYLIPIVYLGAALYCALSRGLRRQAGILLLMFSGIYLSYILLEGTKQGWYLVHILPLFASFVAISGYSLWTSGKLPARMIAVAVALTVLIGPATSVYSASHRNLQQQYLPALAFLNQTLQPKDLIFARSQFYFGLKCKSCLRDDEHLGYYSGRRPNYIVMDLDYEEELEDFGAAHQTAYEDIKQRLARDYTEVFHNPAYRVLKANVQP
jgi:4-amino-4-deoxy-L-arabinose transferase-like glycosyltransferase